MALEKDRARDQRASLPAPCSCHNLNVSMRRRNRGGLFEIERFVEFRFGPLLYESRADFPSLGIAQQRRVGFALNHLICV